jgi:triosephosphate isomerase
MYHEDKVAFTGEVSPLMLAGLCDYVILGHSERRGYFAETSSLISKKVAAAFKHGLKPILCVGEVLAEFEAGRTREVVTEQLTASLAGSSAPEGLVIAYEPVWAIGTGRAATSKQANDVVALIRNTLSALYGAQSAASTRVLYGGSVTAENIAEFVGQPEIDGALVGGASLKPDQFVSIVKQTALARR